MPADYKSEYHQHPIYQRMMAPGPKRILALDGGGIRGALTLGYLEIIEKLLRDRFDSPDYCLSQYFDLIGGTSTGGIIATLLSLGWSVDRIKELYLQLGEKIFAKKIAPWIPGQLRYLFLRANYSEEALEKELNEQLSDIVLGSTRIKTGLCIVTRRADDYGTYTFSNHPGSKYYELNKGILLSDLVRASSAAPTYFKSKMIQFDDNERGIFVDGGVSSANNPALNLFMIATKEEYGYNWHMGRNELLITSLGTGSYRPKLQMKNMAKLLKRKSIGWAPELPNLFMADAASLNHELLEYLANPNLSKHIGEPYNPEGITTFSKGAFTYHRFDIQLNKNVLQRLYISKSEVELASLREMDHGKNAQALYEIGIQSAKTQIKKDHFPRVFDQTKEFMEAQAMSFGEFSKKIIPALREQSMRYQKSRFVLAQEAKGGEQIATVVDHQIETTNVANPGDFIVFNQTSDKEKYIVKPDDFHMRYEFVRQMPDGQKEYRPKGYVLAVQLTIELLESNQLPNHFLFKAPWGEWQYAREGDFIVSNEDYTDIYRASLRMFKETYVAV